MSRVPLAAGASLEPAWSQPVESIQQVALIWGRLWSIHSTQQRTQHTAGRRAEGSMDGGATLLDLLIVIIYNSARLSLLYSLFAFIQDTGS